MLRVEKEEGGMLEGGRRCIQVDGGRECEHNRLV